MLTFSDKPLTWRALLLQLLFLSLTMIIGIQDHRLMLLAFGFNVATMVLGKNQYVLCQLFFLLPFTMIYKNSPTSSSYFAYALSIFALLLILKSKVNLGTIVLLALYLVVGMINKLDIWFKMVSGMVIFLFFVRSMPRESFKYIAISLAIGLLESSIIGLNKVSSPLLSPYFSSFNSEYIDGDFVYRFSALYLDPNYFSIIMICSIFFLTSLVVVKDIRPIVGIPLILALTYFGSLTYSRVFLVSIVLVFVSQTWELIWSSKYRLLVLLLIAVIFSIAIPAIVNSETATYYSGRMGAEDISNGRISIWTNYMDYIFSEISIFLFGVGFGGPLLNGRGAHNSFIEALYNIGLIGLIVYIVTMIRVLNSRKLINKRNFKNYVLTLVFIVMISTLGVMTMNDMMFYFMIIWCSLNVEYKASVLKVNQ